MWEIVLVFGAIGIIVAVIIITVYLLICFINKKLGVDSNGKPIQQQQIKYVESEPKPQVIKIELIQQGSKYMEKESYTEKGYDHVFQTNEIKMINMASDIKQKKVETTFENKRIGKVE